MIATVYDASRLSLSCFDKTNRQQQLIILALIFFSLRKDIQTTVCKKEKEYEVSKLGLFLRTDSNIFDGHFLNVSRSFHLMANIEDHLTCGNITKYIIHGKCGDDSPMINYFFLFNWFERVFIMTMDKLQKVAIMMWNIVVFIFYSKCVYCQIKMHCFHNRGQFNKNKTTIVKKNRNYILAHNLNLIIIVIHWRFRNGQSLTKKSTKKNKNRKEKK